MSNILKAINTIIGGSALNAISDGKQMENRIQQQGSALEKYIKDIFSESDEAIFSWLGNANNPPDLMIKGGVAIEVKKISSLNSTIALNSSYPKAYLYSDDTRITLACRDCEDWTKKHIIYTIGVVQDKKLRVLWMIYGDCFAASKEVYEKAANSIRAGISNSGLSLSKTNELARVNQVDPLGITSLRVRGMWQLSNPNIIFGEFAATSLEKKFTLNVILRQSTYKELPILDRNILETKNMPNLNITDRDIPAPDNPAKTIAIQHIRYEVL